MQGCTDSVVETVDARSAQLQASATAQNGEAEALEARGRRKGAATRLDMDVNMTASGSGATLPVGGDDAARYVNCNTAEGAPAQFMPESVARAEGTARALRGAGLESVFPSRLACEVLMRWGSCLGTRSAEVLRAVFDGL